MAVASARDLALEALLDRQGQVTRHLERLLAEQVPAPAEAGLATELTLGVVRYQRTLDAILRAYSTQPDREMPPWLRQVLRLGLYQLLFLDRVPNFAAVSEAVEQCRRHQLQMAGFVNGLLRSVGRAVREPVTGEVPMKRNIVAMSLDRYRMLDRFVCASPEEQPGEFIADICSLPSELSQRWLKRFGGLRGTFNQAMQANARPVVAARVDLTRTTVQAVLQSLEEEGIEAVAHENGRSIVLTSHVIVGSLEVFRQGLITPQDPTATDVPLALKVRPGMRVLDFCASPGTKTTEIAELMDRRGEILASDVSQDKLDRIVYAALRCRIDIIRTCLATELGSMEPGSFDRVLVDVPCSNSGVLARRVEARWRLSTKVIHRLAEDQLTLLGLASMFLAKGGRLIYSTCSIEPEENEGVVHSFLAKFKRLRVREQKLTLPLGLAEPRKYRDGGYWAALEG